MPDIHESAEKGKYENVVVMVESNPKMVHARDKYGRTPLHDAAFGGHLMIVDYLISMGADVNARTRFGSTPLHAAAVRGRVKVAERLIQYGANVNARDNYGRTPLSLAVFMGNDLAHILRMHGGRE